MEIIKIIFSLQTKRKKFWNLQDIIEAILPLFQGNMLSFHSIVVEEHLDLLYRRVLLGNRVEFSEIFKHKKFVF